MKKQQPEDKYPDPKMLVLKERFLFRLDTRATGAASHGRLEAGNPRPAIGG
jgi:hypothetical protein